LYFTNDKARLQIQIFQLPKKSKAFFYWVLCHNYTTFLSLEDGWEGWEEGFITKAPCGDLTKDYAWIGFAAFDAFEDDQMEA
jgi:hypothetical protein